MENLSVETRVVMDRELVNDYLVRAGMDADQADVLSRILADMERRLATKEDIRVFGARFEVLEHKFDARLGAMETRLTWRMLAIIASLGTIISAVNAVI